MNPKNKLKAQQELIVAQRTEIVKQSKTLNMELLKAAEDNILAESIAIVQGCLGFADLEFDDEGNPQYPKEWDDLPEGEKNKRVRLAKFGCMPSGDFPHGGKLAHQTMVGIIKARATEQSGSKVLNIENATFPSPAPLVQDLEIIEVDE